MPGDECYVLAIGNFAPKRISHCEELLKNRVRTCGIVRMNCRIGAGQVFLCPGKSEKFTKQ